MSLNPLKYSIYHFMMDYYPVEPQNPEEIYSIIYDNTIWIMRGTSKNLVNQPFEL